MIWGCSHVQVTWPRLQQLAGQPMLTLAAAAGKDAGCCQCPCVVLGGCTQLASTAHEPAHQLCGGTDPGNECLTMCTLGRQQCWRPCCRGRCSWGKGSGPGNVEEGRPASLQGYCVV